MSVRRWSVLLAPVLVALLVVLLAPFTMGRGLVEAAAAAAPRSLASVPGAPVAGAHQAGASMAATPAFDECGFTGRFEKRLVQPRSLILACGDANIRLAGLHWTSWGPKSATGRGVDTWNKCRPSCAASKTWLSTAAVVTLSHVVPEPTGPLFALLTLSTPKAPRSPGVGKWVFLPNPCAPSNRAWSESEGFPCH